MSFEFACVGWLVFRFDVGCDDELRVGEGRCVGPRVTYFEPLSMDAISLLFALAGWFLDLMLVVMTNSA